MLLLGCNQERKATSSWHRPVFRKPTNKPLRLQAGFSASTPHFTRSLSATIRHSPTIDGDAIMFSISRSKSNRYRTILSYLFLLLFYFYNFIGVVATSKLMLIRHTVRNQPVASSIQRHCLVQVGKGGLVYRLFNVPIEKER